MKKMILIGLVFLGNFSAQASTPLKEAAVVFLSQQGLLWWEDSISHGFTTYTEEGSRPLYEALIATPGVRSCDNENVCQRKMLGDFEITCWGESMPYGGFRTSCSVEIPMNHLSNVALAALAQMP